MAFNPKQKKSTLLSRTRTGCRTCRARKIKCDEQKPICYRCMNSNLQCSYGLDLIWHEESLSKGICHGRSGVWSKKTRQGWPKRDHEGLSQPHRRLSRAKLETESSFMKKPCQGAVKKGDNHGAVFLNTTAHDIKLYFECGCIEYGQKGPIERGLEGGCSDETIGQHAFPLPFLSNLTPSTIRTLDCASALLSYYESVICSSRTLVDDAKNNPYRHLILPMAMQSEGLYHATLAVSAQILHISEPRFRFAALEHKQKALKCLISSIQREASRGTGTANENGSWSSTDIDEILGLALMLCWFEVTDGCRPSWVTHLKGIYSMFNQHQHIFFTGNSTSDIHRFFNRYFSLHLVLARTAFRIEDDIASSTMELCVTSRHGHYDYLSNQTFHVSSSHSTENGIKGPISKLTALLSLSMRPEDLDQIDSYMGFSNSLLLLINEVADLVWKYDSKHLIESELPLVREHVQRLRLSLETLQQTPPPLEGVSDSQNASEFRAIAEANRLGALLLLHEVCVSRLQRPNLFVRTRQSNRTAAAGMAMNNKKWGENFSQAIDDRARYVREILDPMIENVNRVIRTAALPLWPLFIAGCCVTSEEDRITVVRIFEETEKLKRYGNITLVREVVEVIWRQRDLSVQDDRKRRHAAARARNSFSALSTDTSIPGRASVPLFEWERAALMMGGLKLSLT